MRPILFLLLVTTLTACGQKGALYLPHKAPPPVRPADTTAPVASGSIAAPLASSAPLSTQPLAPAASAAHS
jgi:predicted small lipoprotein YifL